MSEYVSVMPNERLFLLKLISLLDNDGDKKILKDKLIFSVNSYQKKFGIVYFYIEENNDELNSFEFEKTIAELLSIGAISISNSNISLMLEDWGKIIADSFPMKKEEENMIIDVIK